jgi:two-component system sensor histidine kinase/response regulator
VMDGIEATRILRADPRYKALPIIAMTANAMEADYKLCLEAGMNDHIAKPIDPDHLFSVLLRWTCRGDGKLVTTSKQDRFAKTAASEPDLVIPGIDIRSGLKRTGGHRQRYEALLRKFAEQQFGATETMRASLSAGDAATAERTAHSVKGAAGTLGAASLAEAAASAETAIKTRQGVDAALKALSRSLDPVLAAIVKALPEESSGNGAGGTSGDPATVKEPLIRLKTLLENDDGEAADYIIDVKSRFKGVLTPAEIKMLSERIGNFDFDAALKCISGIALRLSLDVPRAPGED